MNGRIVGGRVLCDQSIETVDISIENGMIAALDRDETSDSAGALDASGLLALPGIVDVHGDAFERQIMPRPKVTFPIDVALQETDRQLVSNGITTAYYSVTVSWEPGLRSLEAARTLIERLASMRPRLQCDSRLHIRWETFALEALDDVESWLRQDRQAVLSFNDHTTTSMRKPAASRIAEKDTTRSGLSVAAHSALLEDVWAMRDAVPAAIERLARSARETGAVLFAHDERTPEDRQRFRALGATTSEFPMTRETAAEARRCGEHTVLGAPNVVRGGSHTGMIGAEWAVAEGLCTVLATDYYYPAPLLAAFQLADDGVVALPEAWALVSKNAAAAAGLEDRGVIAPGKRADLILVDDRDPRRPRVVAAYVGGRRVYASG